MSTEAAILAAAVDRRAGSVRALFRGFPVEPELAAEHRSKRPRRVGARRRGASATAAGGAG
ncbi:MAG: hypothetical protein ACRDQI_10130 [Pseudonocardiaceae bacterium]